MSHQRGRRIKKNCASCGKEINPRVADVKRGWGKFCNKSCKAKQQVANIGYPMKEELYHPFSDDAFTDGGLG